MPANGPDDLETIARGEHLYRRGYVAGVFDLLAQLAHHFTPEEKQALQAWLNSDLAAWSAGNLEQAERPPRIPEPVAEAANIHGPWPA